MHLHNPCSKDIKSTKSVYKCAVCSKMFRSEATDFRNPCFGIRNQKNKAQLETTENGTKYRMLERGFSSESFFLKHSIFSIQIKNCMQWNKNRN